MMNRQARIQTDVSTQGAVAELSRSAVTVTISIRVTPDYDV